MIGFEPATGAAEVVAGAALILLGWLLLWRGRYLRTDPTHYAT